VDNLAFVQEGQADGCIQRPPAAARKIKSLTLFENMQLIRCATRARVAGSSGPRLVLQGVHNSCCVQKQLERPKKTLT
jgi:hypothetical protein